MSATTAKTEHCLRPENITNYLVTELSLMKGELDVPVKCKAVAGLPESWSRTLRTFV